MKEFWDYRYAHEDFAYGHEPNAFFKSTLNTLKPGKMLLPAEGEGRNAVYAAAKGWEVWAFDFSESAKEKALQLADNQQVSFNYQVLNCNDVAYPPNTFDAIALIFFHLPAEQREACHKKIARLLKPQGYLIVEAFSKENLKLADKRSNVNGPKDIELLYTLENLKSDFRDFQIIELSQQKVELNEGLFHQGQSDVIRLWAQKKR